MVVPEGHPHEVDDPGLTPAFPWSPANHQTTIEVSKDE
jgi:hypothetical protein